MPEAQLSRSRWRSVLIIIVALTVVVPVLLIGTQVVSVLFGIVMPPLPPVPSRAVEMSHETTDYGVDSWEYRTSSEACWVVLFYETLGGTCIAAQGQCGREGTNQVEPPAVAQCAGNSTFSIFHMRWSASIYQNGNEGTHIDLHREVYWIGTGPTTTPRFDVGQLSPSPNATSEQ